MGWQDWIGTASYALLAASYIVTNIYWLRLLAIVALTAETAYFYVGGRGWRLRLGSGPNMAPPSQRPLAHGSFNACRFEAGLLPWNCPVS